MACICPLILMGIIYGQDDHYFINDLEIDGNESISKNEIIKICNQIGSDVFLGLDRKNSILASNKKNCTTIYNC